MKDKDQAAASKTPKDSLPNSVSDSPELIKYRLLGAVVIFVLLALFGPEVLDGSGRVQTTTIIEIPARPEVPVPPVLKPPLPKGSGFDSDSIEQVQVTQRQQAKDVINAQASMPADKKVGSKSLGTAKESTASKPLLPKTSAVLAENKPAWTLQLATFSHSKNAYALREKLTKTGFNSYSKLLKDSAGKTRYQVFVGPELKKEKLLVIKKKLSEKLRLKDGIIKPYRP